MAKSENRSIITRLPRVRVRRAHLVAALSASLAASSSPTARVVVIVIARAASRDERAASIDDGQPNMSTPLRPPPALVFATTNEGKHARLREHLDRVASSPRVRAIACDVDEIQASTVRLVAIDKARRACHALRRDVNDDECVLVHDCGLCARALAGFPGPVTKFFNFTCGGDGLRKLLADVDDRAACWDETIVVARPSDGAMRVFSREGAYDDGEIGTPMKWRRWRDEPSRSVGAVFVARGFGFDECMCDVEEHEYQRFRRDSPSVYNDFTAWMAGDDTAGVELAVNVADG